MTNAAPVASQPGSSDRATLSSTTFEEGTVTITPPIAAQLLLPGQAAAPAGRTDVSTMYFMHFGFRRDLDAFVAAASTPVTDLILARR